MTDKLLWICLTFAMLLFSGCGGKEEPTPDAKEEIIYDDFGDPVLAEPFYPVAESIADIQDQVDDLRARVIEYESRITVPNFAVKLHELISKPFPTHKFFLKNNTIIEGRIKDETVDYILVDTDVGTLTIEKSQLTGREELVRPEPNVIFLGEPKMDIYEDRRVYTGKVINEGNRRADFVRVIFWIHGKDTDVLALDSSFVDGTNVEYRSGITTDTSIEPEQSARYHVEVPINETIEVEYFTQVIHWNVFY